MPPQCDVRIVLQVRYMCFSG